MDRERAETHLRQVAEAGLRSGDGGRVHRVAQALLAVGALDDEVAAQILADFDLATGARQADPASRRGLLSGRAAQPPRPERATGRPGGRAVPLGLPVPVRCAAGPAELCLLSYAQPAARGLLTMIARVSGPAVPEEALSVLDLGATDDRGNSYGIGLHGSGVSGPGEWLLRLHPDPQRELRWLDLTAGPGEPAVRIELAVADQPAPEATVSAAAADPAGHLLTTIAMRLLAAAAAYPRYMPLYVAGLRVSLVAEGLGDVVEALRTSEAIPALSPLPGQLATLCQYLGIGGHGITAPPSGSLPERWQGVLIGLMRGPISRAPAGSAAAAVRLPEVDGITFTILGVHDTADRTVVFMHADGMTGDGSSETDTGPVIWVRDRAGWHATRSGGSADMDGEVTMAVAVLPPLGRDASWIEVLVAGRSAEARVTLPLRWQLFDGYRVGG